jgi:SAM-dependent methyltransferase
VDARVRSRVSALVRAQYERHPYPPVSALALPSKRPEPELAIALGAELAGTLPSEARPRILVAGAGSLEALVVARANPHAAEILAVDLSEASLATLRRRAWLARIAQPFARTAPITTIVADLLEFESGPFDAIFLSNVLQHVGEPERLLARMAELLAPRGVMRLVVYPRESRLWMRAIQDHLRALGLDASVPSPRARVSEAMQALPESSPLRLSFEVNPESRTDAGVVDAFLHAHDEPLPILKLASCIERVGLRLVGERQSETSRSAFVAEVDPLLAARISDPWLRLAILDESLELCANPVLWLARGTAQRAPHAAATTVTRHNAEPETAEPSASPPPQSDPIRARLAARLDALDELLLPYGSTAEDWIRALAREVGPRVGPPPDMRPLPGLALSDYDPRELRTRRPRHSITG